MGLEVHVQLKTRTKAFCSCSADFGAAPNANTCPVCLALPGALPVLNERAVGLATRAALALNCDVQPVSIFARKNYFYPDLPKGYQISQFDKPLALDGWIEIGTRAGRRADPHRHHARAHGGGRRQVDPRSLLRRHRDRPQSVRRAADRDRERAGHPLGGAGGRVPARAQADPRVRRRQRRQHGGGQPARRRERQRAPSRRDEARHQDRGEEHELLLRRRARAGGGVRAARRRARGAAARSSSRRCSGTRRRCARRARRRAATTTATSPSPTCRRSSWRPSGSSRCARTCPSCPRRDATRFADGVQARRLRRRGAHGESAPRRLLRVRRPRARRARRPRRTG